MPSSLRHGIHRCQRAELLDRRRPALPRRQLSRRRGEQGRARRREWHGQDDAAAAHRRRRQAGVRNDQQQRRHRRHAPVHRQRRWFDDGARLPARSGPGAHSCCRRDAERRRARARRPAGQRRRRDHLRAGGGRLVVSRRLRSRGHLERVLREQRRRALRGGAGPARSNAERWGAEAARARGAAPRR